MGFSKAKALQEAHQSAAQGKTARAIKQYQWIVEKDPSDLTLLNVIGDLYAQDNNISEALKYFYKLASAYSRDGYKVKAVAIYKKISKIDRNAAEPLLKLAELNSSLGLAREAREQYRNAFELFDRSGQKNKALESLRKLSKLDSNSPGVRLKLAQFAERAGEVQEAGEVYLEAAMLAHQCGDVSAAEIALNRAAELVPENPKVHLYRARQALTDQKSEEAETILASVPELQDNLQAQRLLLESYLITYKLDSAKGLLLDLFHSDPADFSLVADFVERCIEKQQFDVALEVLRAVSPDVIGRPEASPMMEAFRRLWKLSPAPTDALELAYYLAEKTADEATIPEILEALGNAQIRSGLLEKAERTYANLVARDPENETYKDLFQQVLKIQGKQYVPLVETPFVSADVGLETETELARDGAADDPALGSEQEAIVKGAITNSDLLVRDGLTERAVEELEKVLRIYPDQVDIHNRIVEVCREKLPSRAVQAAEVLARIYSGHGDNSEAKRYHEEALELAQTAANLQSPHSPSLESSSQILSREKPEEQPTLLVSDLSGSADEERPQENGETISEPQKISSGLKTSQMLDHSTEEPAFSQGTFHKQRGSPSGLLREPGQTGAPSLNYEESREEIEFYLRHRFYSEANKAVDELTARYPEEGRVAELRQLVDQRTQGIGSTGKFQAVQETDAETVNEQEWDLPTSFTEKEEPPGRKGSAGELTAELASAPALADPHDPTMTFPSSAANGKQVAAPQSADDVSAVLGSLLDELNDGNETIDQTADDVQTHYNLGVAFREMGLLDEAVGEFQKVVKGGGSERFVPNFLQGCTLLASCFMDKGMPAIAAKWYSRALEAPGLDHDGMLAIYYDLGTAFEKAGNSTAALEKFTEVYSQNIDYRDVAEKIRLLRQSAR